MSKKPERIKTEEEWWKLGLEPPSEILKEMWKKGEIITKAVSKIVERKKLKQPSDVLKTLRTDYLLGKIAKLMSLKVEETAVSKKDMFSGCRLAYDGIQENKDEVNNTMKELLEKPTIANYDKAMSPLGNMIIGYKVLKHYCQPYIKPDEYQKAETYYKQKKKEFETIDEAFLTEANKHIREGEEQVLYKHQLNRIKRLHGVIPQLKRHLAPVLYNIKGRPIKYVDLFDIDELIAEFEFKHPEKFAVHHGKETKAFRDWLDKY